MFSNLKLSMKMGLGFGCILILLSIVLLVSISALQQADEGISQYRGLARNTNLTGQLQTSMFNVRMNVKDFMLTQDEQELQYYRDDLSSMKAFLDDANSHIEQADRVALIKQTYDAIDTYEEAFQQVVTLMKQRDTVEKDKLVPAGEKMRVLIENFIDSAYQDGDSEAVYHSSHVQKKMLIGRLYVVKFLQSNLDTDYKLAVENMKNSFKEELEDLEPYLNSAQRTKIFNEFSSAHSNYIQSMDDIHNLIVEIQTITEKTLNRIGVQVANNMEDINLSIMKDQDTLGPQLKQNTDRSVNLTLMLSAIAIVLGIVSAYFLTVTITRPIEQAVNAANLLAEGDLTVDVGATRGDETGKLLQAVQNTAINLKQMMLTISNASSELASASEELAVVTEQTSKGISQQEAETDMVATAMNEMTTTIHDVADNAAKASSASNQAEQDALYGAKVVHSTINSINSLSVSVNNSSQKLSEVQQEVNNISGILKVISEIADQTNLLALNAAIEAARAGEQGRGFAVVADEVRSLAERTQGSTTEIQAIIEQLQVGTQSTVEAMNEGKQLADSCVDQAEKTNAALEAITQSIGVINDMNMQIASASEQQSIVSEEINRNIVNVKRVAEENSVAANQTSSSSLEIARLAEDLGQLVSQFKV